MLIYYIFILGLQLKKKYEKYEKYYLNSIYGIRIHINRIIQYY